MTGSVLNIIIKLLAVLLAVLLWFNVITEKQYEYELTLPITYFEFPSALGPVSELPDSLAIKVLAEGKRLLRNDWKRAGLRIKATRVERGNNTLDMNVETVSLVRGDNVTLLDIPATAPITVQMDRIDSTLRPVAARLAVVPNDGYMIVTGQGAVTPHHVRIIGPRQLLNQIDSIYTEQKVVDNAGRSVDAMLCFENPNPRSLMLRRDSAEVSVIVEKIRHKELKQVPIEILPRSGTNPIVDPPQLAITVQGPESIIDSISERHVRAFVAVPGPDQPEYVRPTLQFPNNVSAIDIKPDSVRVIISP